jgi:hypothetical protein
MSNEVDESFKQMKEECDGRLGKMASKRCTGGEFMQFVKTYGLKLKTNVCTTGRLPPHFNFPRVSICHLGEHDITLDLSKNIAKNIKRMDCQ